MADGFWTACTTCNRPRWWPYGATQPEPHDACAPWRDYPTAEQGEDEAAFLTDLEQAAEPDKWNALEEEDLWEAQL